MSDAQEDLPPDWTPLSDAEPEADAESDVSGDDIDVAPDETGLCVDHDPEPWSRKILGAGGTVVFTEVMYKPANGSNLAWVELYNPFSIDMDVSGWRLSGDVSYLFPDDTFMPPGGTLVVASDPGAMGLPGAAEALGPWSGILPPWKGTIELRSNTDRLMDLVSWTAADPWPVTAAGSGASLSKVNPLSPSEEAESWRGSWTVGGSPGAANFPEDEISANDSGLRISELSAGGNAFWIELVNTKDAPSDLADLVLASSTGPEVTLSPWSLMPGELALLTEDELGFAPPPGELLFLYSPGKAIVLDGVTVTNDPRARAEAGGGWTFPKPPTPGEINTPSAPGTVAINEIMYHHAPVPTLDGGAVASTEEWIELYNAGADPVDLGGWSLVDAIEFQLPPDTILPPGEYLVVAKDADTLGTQFPGITIVGDFKGKLDNSSERVALLDECGDLMDEVRYADGGRWPQWADGGGSSLELRDPLADNSAPEAWASSIESEGAAWQTFVFDEIVQPSLVGPDGQWKELVLGLLDAGEVLLDDLSLIEDPEGVAIEMLQNGTFEGSGAASWRLLGTHRASEVIEDPTVPGNHVLRLRATGATEHMHNHAETTLANGASIQNGVLYSLSFRARWVAGSNQLNSRLYFNRLAHTTLLERPALNGTPGAQNSQWINNLGPTYSAFSHSPAVPQSFEPVDVRIQASDPDGVQELTLWYALDGGAAQSLPMIPDGQQFVAQIPGATAGTITQFWVEGIDQAGSSSNFPQDGAAARALFKVVDGPETPPAMHTLRILLTPDDDAWIFAPENVMSNDRIPATVIWDEKEVFYNVGVRLKGSERGRPIAIRVGFAIYFDPAHLFRGVYESVMVDRSEGVKFGQREMLVNLMMARSGSVSTEYNDLIHVYATREAQSGSAELQLARFGDQLLSFQFEDGEDGSLYEYELIYFPTTTTDGSPESPKVPAPDLVVGTPITSLGDDKEAYRPVYTVKNNRWKDDFSTLMAFAQAFGATGGDFAAQMAAIMDVDQWLRAFAFCILANPVDNFGTGAGHNAQFYVRPTDGRVLFFPHDLDFYGSAPQNAVTSSQNLQKLIASPIYARVFYGHVVDIVQTSYNGDYMAHWCQQLGTLLPAQDFAGHLQFIVTRAAWVLSGATNSVLQAIPEVSFEITTNGGADFESEGASISLAGQGWVDVHSIWRSGAMLGLPVSWVDGTHWATTINLACGPNLIELDARNQKGSVVGTDAVVITRMGVNCP
ncbi:MAG: lamin tail domain-containing protein [Pseudomonadota bacterium]